MILGYNKERPKAKNYRDFEHKLVSGLTELGIDGLSLMLYGSYVRGDLDIGRSDIDAVMIFPDNVVIDKQNLHKASIVIHQALKGNHVPFQVNVTDATTMKDGRFDSYDNSFRGYFDEEARITGIDYRPQINYELPTMNEQVSVRFNLRKTRSGLLFAEHDMNEDYESFLVKFTKSLDAVSRSSKQILYFVDGKLRKNRFSAMQIIRENFPEVNIGPLSRIKRVYNNPRELDDLYRNPLKVLEFWNSTVTFMEEMIREYIKKHPKVS